MNVALCFFGITRSLKYTIASIQSNILNELKNNNIKYDIYLHTFRLDNYTNIRTKEKCNNVDNSEYTLLNPDYYSIENQNLVKDHIDIKKYRSKKDYWNTQYNSVDNFILAQYSKYKLYLMIKIHQNMII